MGVITKNGERGAPRPPRAPRSLSSSSPDCSPEVETKGCSFFYENKQNHLTSRQRLLPRSVLFSLVFGFFFFLIFFFPSPFLLFSVGGVRVRDGGTTGTPRGPSVLAGGGRLPQPRSAEPPRDEASPASGLRWAAAFGGLRGSRGGGGAARCCLPPPRRAPPAPRRGFKSRPGSSAAPKLGLFFPSLFLLPVRESKTNVGIL